LPRAAPARRAGGRRPHRPRPRRRPVAPGAARLVGARGARRAPRGAVGGADRALRRRPGRRGAPGPAPHARASARGPPRRLRAAAPPGRARGVVGRPDRPRAGRRGPPRRAARAVAPSGGPRAAPRLTRARRLAARPVEHARQRPEVVLAWSSASPRGRASDAPDDLAWQPEMWRRLVDRVPATDPARRVAEAVETLRADPDAVDLPSRLSVFGPTRLPEDELRVLRALAEHRDVHVWLVHPSPALWTTVADHAARSAADEDRARRADPPTLARHPFLASTGRDAVELQLRLAGSGAREHHHEA